MSNKRNKCPCLFLPFQTKMGRTSSTAKWNKSHSPVRLLSAPLYVPCAAGSSTLSSTEAGQCVLLTGLMSKGRGRGNCYQSIPSWGYCTKISQLFRANPHVSSQPASPAYTAFIGSWESLHPFNSATVCLSAVCSRCPCLCLMSTFYKGGNPPGFS